MHCIISLHSNSQFCFTIIHSLFSLSSAREAAIVSLISIQKSVYRVLCISFSHRIVNSTHNYVRRKMSSVCTPEKQRLKSMDIWVEDAFRHLRERTNCIADSLFLLISLRTMDDSLDVYLKLLFFAKRTMLFRNNFAENYSCFSNCFRVL